MGHHRPHILVETDADRAKMLWCVIHWTDVLGPVLRPGDDLLHSYPWVDSSRVPARSAYTARVARSQVSLFATLRPHKSASSTEQHFTAHTRQPAPPALQPACS